MTVTERHSAPYHYLFNTDLVDDDPSIFDTTSTSSVSNNDNGRGAVLFKTLNSHTGNINVVVKQYRRGGMIRHLTKNLYWHSNYKQSRAWPEFELLAKLTSMGLPVPMPVAGKVKKICLQWHEATIITQEIEQCITLADRLKQRPVDAAGRNLWNNIGETIKRFHTANVYHADLNASNILITGTNDIYLIDFDKGQFLSDSDIEWKNRNLERLQRSLLKYKKQNDQFRYSTENWDALLAGYER